MVTREILEIFHDDLWKDKRLMDPQDEIFVKKSENEIEHKTEISVLNYLRKVGISGIPEIKKTEGLDIYMSIFKGIRVFELLVILDELSIKHENAIEVKKKVIERCNERQRRIQIALKEWRECEIRNGQTRIKYPQDKIKKIVEVLAVCKDIPLRKEEFHKEMKQLIDYWETVADIPFRDATTKNMVFCDPNFQRIELEPSESKTEKNIKQVIAKLDDNTFWESTPIADFDFSSCVHDTTIEDDYISLNCHERTFNGNTYIDPKDLIWIGTPDSKRAAISFYVRYYRFGGRKAAYRLLNPVNHMVRFQYDHDDFYFRNLNSIMRNLCPIVDVEFPSLLQITEDLAKRLGTNLAVTDSFYKEYPFENRQPWQGLNTIKINNFNSEI
ncbi:MAG: hypothetical protein CVU13_07705 [Bacteroidetes bacterium HGW-Bacteroidetes-8]|jgi:hypothetical protein|nr:MAG: hypothetical protein CVU13_07705 [Bacteroidetes bacterium HGW-Bacteroidetes-8]